MASAWLEYDDVGQPTIVRWSSGGGREIEITKEMAGSFMDGSENMHLYHVEEVDGSMLLKKKDVPVKEPARFWSLDALDESGGASMLSVDKEGMTITIDGNRSSSTDSIDALDESGGASMLSVDKEGMTITIDGNRSSSILYATIKNDPSWLIKSWNLTNMAQTGNTIRINWADADKHSFYIGGYR